jgi:transaldolase
VTLLFGLPRYREVAEAYIAGIEARLAQGKSVKHVTSVASFFVSRIDVIADPILKKLMAKEDNVAQLAKMAHGQVAISSTKVAYQIYKEIFGGERFTKLVDKGGQKQRLLWARSGTKDPDFSDVNMLKHSLGRTRWTPFPLKPLTPIAITDNPRPGSRKMLRKPN